MDPSPRAATVINELTTSEAVRRIRAVYGLEVSRRTLQRLCARGQVPHRQALGGQYLFPVEDFEAIAGAVR